MKITKKQHDHDQSPEHPDDRKLRIAGEKYGQKHAAGFCARQAVKMRLLIASYSDAEAEEILRDLRELFWLVSLDDELPNPQTSGNSEGI